MPGFSWISHRWRPALIAGLGGFLAIALLALGGELLQVMTVIAPFGASSVLVFGAPSGHFAQPRNVIGGHVLSAAIGVAVFASIGSNPVAMGLGVALSIAAMILTDTVHPPAGADPLVAISLAATWRFPLMPVLAGAIAIVALGWVYHRLISRQTYPSPAPARPREPATP